MDDAKYIEEPCLISPRFSELVPAGTFSFVTPHPYAIYAQVLALLYPDATIPVSNFGTCGISPKANIHASAIVGYDVTIDPGASIGPNARIGDFTCIGSNAVIGPVSGSGGIAISEPTSPVAHAVVGDRVYSSRHLHWPRWLWVHVSRRKVGQSSSTRRRNNPK